MHTKDCIDEKMANPHLVEIDDYTEMKMPPGTFRQQFNEVVQNTISTTKKVKIDNQSGGRPRGR